MCLVFSLLLAFRFAQTKTNRPDPSSDHLGDQYNKFSNLINPELALSTFDKVPVAQLSLSQALSRGQSIM